MAVLEITFRNMIILSLSLGKSGRKIDPAIGVNKNHWFFKQIRFYRGYRDSLLETAQEAVTIAPTRVHS